MCSGHELLRPHDISGASLPPGKKTVDISRDYAVYYISYEKRGVAQLAERLVRDQEAVRSSRITPTNHSARIASTVRASFLHRNARPLVYSILGPRPQAQRAPRPCVQVASLRPFIQPGSRQRSGLLFYTATHGLLFIPSLALGHKHSVRRGRAFKSHHSDQSISPDRVNGPGVFFCADTRSAPPPYKQRSRLPAKNRVFLLYLPAPICYNLDDFHECVSLCHFVLWNIAKKTKIYL